MPLDSCPDCGTAIAPDALACPNCSRLLRSDELKRLSSVAAEAEAIRNFTTARDAWASALELLPPNTRQHAKISLRIRELDDHLAATRRAQETPPPGVSGAVALLLSGLASPVTLISMAVFFGAYAAMDGWQLGLGLVISIYIHEMGHVFELRRFGLPASVPIFIPGFGAFIFLRSKFLSAAQDARIGLAGPLWGLGAAVACRLMAFATHSPAWESIARMGAFLNLLNLTPVWTLDGGRGIHGLTRIHRIALLITILGALAYTRERLLAALAIACVYQLFVKDIPQEADNTVLVQFVVLVVALSILARNAI